MRQVGEAIEATVASIASKAASTGTAVTILGWLTSSNFGMWMGIVLGLAGLMVNWYYKQKADRRHDEAHKIRIRQLQSNTVSNTLEADE